MIHFPSMISFVLLLVLYSTTEADEQQYKRECQGHTSSSGSTKGFFYRETAQCFILHKNSKNWNKAQEKCREVADSNIFGPGNLAKAHDVMTIKKLQKLLNDMTNSDRHIWFGGRNEKNCADDHRPDEFRWISDETTMEHSAWYLNQPTYNLPGECCAVFEVSSTTGFHDYDCEWKYHFMCALEAKGCSPPTDISLPSNTYISATKSFYLNGQTLDVQCEQNKWLLSGQGSVQTITCNTPNNDWGLSVVENCYACTRPKASSDTYTIEMTDFAFYDGQVLTVRCKPNLWVDQYGNTEQTISCRAKQNQWTGLHSLKKCYACQRPNLPPDSKNYVVGPEEAFKDKSEVMVSCDPDHSYNKEGNENQTITCNAKKDEWTPNLSELKPCKKDCKQSTLTQPHVKLASEKTAYSSGEEIQVHCVEGKVFEDSRRSKTVKCDNGDWMRKGAIFKELCVDSNKNARAKIRFKKVTDHLWLKVLIAVAAVGGLATVVVFIAVGTVIFRAEKYESSWKKDKATAKDLKAMKNSATPE